MECNPGCSTVGPPWGHKPVSKSAPGWRPLFTSLLGAWYSKVFPQGHSLRAVTCSGMGLSMGCRWMSALLWNSMARRDTFDSPWSSPPWSSSQIAWESLYWLLEDHWHWWLQRYFPHIFQLFSPSAAVVQHFFSFLKSVTSVADWGWSLVSLSPLDSGSSSQLLREATPVESPLPKPCQASQIKPNNLN